ncbi:MAG: YlxR family protein [Candidatus Adiutrix sp.]|nr:YlxR family protein [Candidatus Adiutrix sp.]
MGEGSGPLRTCLGCRARKEQGDMERVALVSGPDGPKVVWDCRRRLGGRGGWLCRGDEGCLAAALKRRAFGRAFRVEGALDLSEIAVASRATILEKYGALPQAPLKRG